MPETLVETTKITFGLTEDGSIEVISHEVDEDEEEYGKLGEMSADELRLTADILEAIFSGGESAQAPEYEDDIELGQASDIHRALGGFPSDSDALILRTQPDGDKGVVLHDHQVFIDAADALDEAEAAA
jgi:hypothetical protein